jgi:alpha-tubulin suppressor-like RCC1 family protein
MRILCAVLFLSSTSCGGMVFLGSEASPSQDAATAVVDSSTSDTTAVDSVTIETSVFEAAIDSEPDSALPTGDAVEIAIGIEGHCARTSTGKLRCWGVLPWDTSGAIALEPGPPISGLGEIAKVVMDGNRICLRMADGTVQCGGKTDGGLLGDGVVPAVEWSVLTPVPGLTGVKDLALGVQACAVMGDGTVRCWGGCEVGPDAPPCPRTPTAVSGLTDVANIASGFGTTCALRSTHDVWCWGDNTVGQLGDGTTTSRTTAAPVTGLTDVQEIAIGGFDTSVCARKGDGSVWCWGRQYRVAETYADVTTPTKVEGFAAAPKQLATVAANACAILETGALQCWGSNDLGWLAFPSMATESPLTVPSVKEATFVVMGGTGGHFTPSLGSTNACVIVGGLPLCWGRDPVGDGTKTPRDTPTPVKW